MDRIYRDHQPHPNSWGQQSKARQSDLVAAGFDSDYRRYQAQNPPPDPRDFEEEISGIDDVLEANEHEMRDLGKTAILCELGL